MAFPRVSLGPICRVTLSVLYRLTLKNYGDDELKMHLLNSYSGGIDVKNDCSNVLIVQLFWILSSELVFSHFLYSL